MINTLVSSANDIGLENVFIPRGRSLIYSINNKCPRIDPRRTPHFIVPHWDENFS
jgi:hypothetical protein